MLKKLLSIIIAATLMFLAAGQAFAENEIQVFIDGEKINFEEQPFIENGTTMVPFRPIFEKLGLDISWNGEAQTVFGINKRLWISLKVGNTSAVMNNQETKLSLAPSIVNGSTFVPLRFVGEATGKNVIWEDKTKSIYIHSSVEDYLLPKFGVKIYQLQA